MKTLSAALMFLVITVLAGVASANQADSTAVVITATEAGPTPFISKLSLTVSELSVLDRVQFAITPQTGSVTRPISATYTIDYLQRRAYVDAAAGHVVVPIFGLYAAYGNKVGLLFLC